MQMQGTRQIKQIIGENIRSRRDELQLSRRELGTKIDADVSLIYKWERGLHRPEDLTLQAVAQALGRDYAWFFTDRSEERAAA